MTITHLEALLAIAEHGSFTRAAQSLGRTQSAVSRAIAGLEHQLGAPVIHRGTDGAVLTELGQQAARHGKLAMHELHAIESLAMRANAPRLRVGAIASALPRLVPEATSALHRSWPHATVWTVQGDDDELADWLAEETIDLAITSQPRTADPAEAQLSLLDEFLAVVPHQHPLAQSERVPLAALTAAGVADPGGTCGPQLAAGFAANGVPWQPDHLVRDVSTVLAMAKAGITAGVVPALAVPRQPPPGVALRPLDPVLHRQLYVRYPANQREATEFALLLERAATN
ncbi:DNA-binding transcriptional LysR family regulator [Tamaricihabitans halophyticus]|uniref:DNA-binding transcriptional LysR family regulator n=1 Tax=Tamaricihabitans halophyticus TaxID=1262583 RepID=A0A4V2SUB5_9PSEU|nr:LysR family transcriptional regulator [Tamaricihabitans halophyticus]TCP53986.1 DNA-binding transcriptional LysR family regulator [Tamaricihabitans halophyticus]